MIHKGISKDTLKKSFTIVDDVEIKGVRVKRWYVKSINGKNRGFRGEKTKNY